MAGKIIPDTMQIEAFLLCDAAVDYQGRLSLLGAFDTICAPQAPVKKPHCAVALRVRFENSEAGNHQVRIALIDDDGRAFGPKIEGTVQVNAPQGAPSTAANLILGINNPEFPKFGDYSFDLVIDGSLKARLPLFVRPAAEMKKAT